MPANDDFSSTQQQQKKLDDIFKQFVDGMKPTFPKLQVKEKKIVGAWLKKLSHTSIKTITERKNRNLYSQILLQMLQRQQIKEPFRMPPGSGKLPTIPAYMAGYLDEADDIQYPVEKQHSLTPDWLHEDSVLSHSIFHESYPKYKDILTPKKRERFVLPKYITEEVDPTVSFNDDVTISPDEQKRPLDDVTTTFDIENSTDVNELEFYLQQHDETPSRKYEHSPSQNRASSPHKKKSAREEYEEKFAKKNLMKTITEQTGSKRDEQPISIESNNVDFTKDQMEVKWRVMLTRSREEKLKLQQEHDHMVQKILDRKNKESEDIKVYYQNKISELEDRIKDESLKVNTVNAELEKVRKFHVGEVDRLKEAVEKSSAHTATEYEKLMYDKLAEFEQEMFEMQKTHRHNVRDVLAQAEERTKTLKNQHEGELNAVNGKLRTIDAELKSSKQKIKDLALQIHNIKLEKDDVRRQLDEKSNDLNECKSRYKSLQGENTKLTREYEVVVKDLKTKSNKAFEDMRKERESSMGKTSEIITELEMKISQYRETVQDIEIKRTTELKEKDATHQKQMIDVQLVHEKKARSLQSDFERKEVEYQSKIGHYEYTIKLKEDAISNLDGKLAEHTKDSEQMIEQFRLKAEHESNQMFAELNSKVSYFQTCLQKATEQLEEQKTTFKNKYSDQREKFETKMNELKQTNESEKLRLHQNYKQEKHILIENHQKERENLSNKNQSSCKDKELKYKEHVANLAKTISGLEAQNRELREQVQQANSLRKEQVKEVNVLRDEEKRTYVRNEESLHSKYSTQIDQLRLEMQKDHNQQMTTFTEKMNKKLKDLEEHYTGKLSYEECTISSLQKQLSDINQELLEKTNAMEKRLEEISSRSTEEKHLIEQKLQSSKQKLLDELETSKAKYKQLERRYRDMETQYHEKLSSCFLQSEEKMKGLLPISVQKELEDTITTMREQISILKSRAQVLQEELDATTLQS